MTDKVKVAGYDVILKFTTDTPEEARLAIKKAVESLPIEKQLEVMCEVRSAMAELMSLGHWEGRAE